jgi:antitoxin component YwqK of YwqJK toxin-antitoxin module
MPNESVKWVVKSVNRFASGAVRLTWYKAGKFVVGYECSMVNGKLHGKTKCFDSSGDVSIRHWNNGVKVR